MYLKRQANNKKVFRMKTELALLLVVIKHIVY